MKQPSSSAKSSNAISLLKSDHRMVEDLFKQIESTRDDVELAELVVALQTALSVHTRIEEEVFYPALRASVSKAGDLLDEAAVEHGSAKHFLIDLSTSSNDHRFYRARLKVLKEHVNHHVREEEEKLMPMAESSDIDLDELGALLSERRDTLMTALEQGMQLPPSIGKPSARASSAPRPPH